jgi:hypothetical protein
MTPRKLFTILPSVEPANFAEAMQQAIAVELATIPTYLSTYYSIIRAQDQDDLYAKLLTQLAAVPHISDVELAQRAQELKVDILVYANQAAALIMSVVIEEMLHLALSSNIKQAIVGPPDLLSINKILVFPTQLDGHEPAFPINAAKLSLAQLSTFLQIESPKPFVDPADTLAAVPAVDYRTIGQLYADIERCIMANFPGPYSTRPQLISGTKSTGQQRPYYSQNSINTVYYDREHNPHFGSSSDSGDLIGVFDAESAVKAIAEIKHQGEGNEKEHQSELRFGPDHLPIPLPVIDGKVQFQPGDYDDASGGELSHFAKFLEVYSLGVHYQQKFAAIGGLADFFSYFVHDQADNPKQADYEMAGAPAGLALASRLGNAVFTYILLMIETCYHADEHTQFRVFMYGVHKSMIWLLSGVGNSIRGYTYAKGTQKYAGALTFEYYDFHNYANNALLTPKQQLLILTEQLAEADPTNWSWLTQPENSAYWPSLPDVRLDHRVAPYVPAIPA